MVENSNFIKRLRNVHLEKSAVTGLFHPSCSPTTAKTPCKVHLRLRFQNLGKPRTAALYLVLKSNGLPRPKIRLKKFGFSSKSVPANIAKKLPLQRRPKPLFIASFNFSHKRRNVRFKGLRRVHTPPHPRIAHTAAYTPKQGPSFPRPQRGFALPVKSILFRHAFIYIHFPVLCESSTPAEENNPAKLPP